jgi:N-acetylated-alpha-linked acidic dipeptidase
MAHLAVAFNWDRKPLYDVVATIPGATDPDEWVIRGNHHDAWVNGAEDPVSGASAELEEARALGELVKQGWKPARTVIYCFWDGEEPGLLGSTEWAEYHEEELKKHAVAYFNSDSNSRGFLYASGTHSLENFVNGVAKDVKDPDTKLSVWERNRLAARVISSVEERAEAMGRADWRIDALGSGSDYTVFVDHLGVPTVDLGFGGEDDSGQYHSIYDDFYYYTHFKDTDFTFGRALAQTAGTMVMRMADADVLPYQFTDQAETLHTYVTQVEKLADTMRTEITNRNADIADGAFAAAADPRKASVPPPVDVVPPHFNFAPLDNASDDLTAAAAAYEKAFAAHGTEAEPASVDAILLETEHALMDPEGLPNRSWFENMIYAPGFYTGYGVKTLPAVREALEQKEWSMVDAQIVRTAAAMEREVERLKAATKAVEKAGIRE